MPTVQVKDIVYHGYRIAGVLARAGRGYSTSQFTDGLWELNALIDEWQAQRTLVTAVARTQFLFTVNKQTYVVGTDTTAGQWNGTMLVAGTPDIVTPRPERLEAAGYIFTNVTPVVEQPMRILTAQEWEALSPKQLTSTIATALYYQPLVPNGLIWLHPIPTVAYSGAIYTWINLQGNLVLSTDPLILAPAYLTAVTYNLAIRLSAREPERKQLDPITLTIARDALQRIRSINEPELIAMVEGACREVGIVGPGGHYSIISNRYI